MNTVYSLRKQGWKVRVLHFRVTNKNNLKPKELKNRILDNLIPASKADYTNGLTLTHGGLTIVQILDPKGRESQGLSLCSLKDTYNRKLGLKIALNRALVALDTPTPLEMDVSTLLKHEPPVIEITPDDSLLASKPIWME